MNTEPDTKPTDGEISTNRESGRLNGLVRLSVINDYHAKCSKEFGGFATQYQKGVLQGLECAMALAGTVAPGVHPVMACSECGEFQGHGHECKPNVEDC